MSTAPLVAVAHGSRDARSAATVRRLVETIRGHNPQQVARPAFLDLSTPALRDVLRQLHAEGHTEVVVVPLLLGSAFHSRVDLPQIIAQIRTELPLLRVCVADVLGPDLALESAALDRLAQAGAETGGADLGVVLSGVGSAHAPANDAVARIAERWGATCGFAAVTHAFATAAPDVQSAITRLRARGARRLAVAPWFLAPGLLFDRVTDLARHAAPEIILAEPMGAHPLVAELILERYEQVLASAHHAA